jgi:hypothetical protein
MRLRLRLIWLAMAGAAGVPAFGSLVNLNTTSPFGLVGGTITTTGTSMVNGNVEAANTMTTGPGLSATGVVSAGDPTAVQAYDNFESTYNSAELLSSTASFAGLTTSETFTANSVNTFTETNVSTASGVNLTFDAQNSPNAVFVIITSGTLNVNSGLTFTLENGAQASNIFWIVGTAATINSGNSGPVVFDGNILAEQSVTMSTAGGESGMLGGTINGCVFAEGSVTMTGYTNINGCNFDDSFADAPEPGTAGMVGFGFLAGIFLASRKLRREGRRG